MATLGEYVAERSRGRGLYRALREVYAEVSAGNLELLDPSPPTGLAAYLLRLDYSLWFWLTVLLSALTALLVRFSRLHPALAALRYVLGSIFVLFLPGYVTVEALYPSERDLSPLERLALSIGLSLAIVPLLGLLLNYTPWGIRLEPVVAALLAFVVAVGLAAAARKAAVVRMESELSRKAKVRGRGA